MNLDYLSHFFHPDLPLSSTEETIHRVGTVLGAAFEDDPVTVLILGGNHALAAPHMEANFRSGLFRGTAYLASFSKDDEDQGEEDVDDIVGAALWCEPGSWISRCKFVSGSSTLRESDSSHLTGGRTKSPSEASSMRKSHQKHMHGERTFSSHSTKPSGINASIRTVDAVCITCTLLEYTLPLDDAVLRLHTAALVRHGLEIADKAGIETALDTGAPENVRLHPFLHFLHLSVRVDIALSLRG